MATMGCAVGEIPATRSSGRAGDEEEGIEEKSSCGGCDARKEGNGATTGCAVGEVPATCSSGRAGDEEE